jgi:hypothetical protein
MVGIANAALFGVACFYTTWVLYLAVMALKRAKDAETIGRVATTVGTPVLWVGLVFDVVFNIILSVPFLELPKELLVTGRLSRHVREAQASGKLGVDRAWRQRLAFWLCRNFLDTFDPTGSHCK